MSAPTQSVFRKNIAQRGDALDLLRSLPDTCSPLGFFDPQYRGVMDKLKFGNEGARRRKSELDKELADNARLLLAWRQWHREQRFYPGQRSSVSARAGSAPGRA